MSWSCELPMIYRDVICSILFPYLNGNRVKCTGSMIYPIAWTFYNFRVNKMSRVSYILPIHDVIKCPRPKAKDILFIMNW